MTVSTYARPEHARQRVRSGARAAVVPLRPG